MKELRVSLVGEVIGDLTEKEKDEYQPSNHRQTNVLFQYE